MGNRSYDAVVIGGGPGGYSCAIRLGQLKQKVACVEKEEVGGVCLNWGCITAKALIAASHLYEKAQHASTMGIKGAGIEVDVGAMEDWEGGIVKKLPGGVRGRLKGNGAELIGGTATVTSPTTIEVAGLEGKKETIEAKSIVLATGSSTIEIPQFKFDKGIIGAKEAVSLREIPKRMLVIGGGVIGLELGCVYQKVGPGITVAGKTPAVLPRTAPHATAAVRRQ